MPKSLIGILLAASLVIAFSQIYFQRRKLWRMADEDLKRVDYERWKKQLRSNAYISFVSRVIWGLVTLGGSIFYFARAPSNDFNVLFLVIALLGISLIVWGIVGCRIELKRLATGIDT